MAKNETPKFPEIELTENQKRIAENMQRWAIGCKDTSAQIIIVRDEVDSKAALSDMDEKILKKCLTMAFPASTEFENKKFDKAGEKLTDAHALVIGKLKQVATALEAYLEKKLSDAPDGSGIWSLERVEEYIAINKPEWDKIK